ncbi:MAG TPA: alpha/beta fold hydrolase, partial [Actinomycetota bacterium]|nr:alpha/beta fold hydrolase [Actinomycetota bacterium]
MEQRVGCCTSRDGVRIAYAVHGSGPPIVRPSTWLTHLEHDWRSPVWRHWLEELGRANTVVRYDERGCGLSDRDVEDLSLEAWLWDLDAVVEAVGLDAFDLLGMSQGGPTAIAYAAGHAERVRRLVLYGTYLRGRLRRSEADRREGEMLAALAGMGWGRSSSPAFRRAFAELFVPDAMPEQLEWFVELQRISSSAEMASRIRLARGAVDVSALAARIAVPTLVLHARDDRVVPFEEGRLVAATIPGARFVPIEGRNHILLADEPGWHRFVAEFRSFVGGPDPRGERLTARVTRRELEVLVLVAEGLDNEAIARRLFLSVRTVERHLSNLYRKLGVSGRSARA